MKTTILTGVFLLALLILSNRVNAQQPPDPNCEDSCQIAWIQGTFGPWEIPFTGCFVVVTYRHRTNCNNDPEIVFDDYILSGNCNCSNLGAYLKRLNAIIIADVSPTHHHGSVGPMISRTNGVCFKYFYVFYPWDLIYSLGWTNEVIMNTSRHDADGAWLIAAIPCGNTCCIKESTPVEINNVWHTYDDMIYAGECDDTDISIPQPYQFTDPNGKFWELDTEPHDDFEGCETVCSLFSLFKKEGNNINDGPKEKKQTLHFKIKPNPSSDQVNIMVPDDFLNGKLNIFDSNGRLVFTKNIEETKIEVNVRSHNKGTYFFQFISLKGKTEIINFQKK
jgi:hypothetical protein